MRNRFIIAFSALLSLSCGKITPVSETKGALNAEVQKCYDYPAARYTELDAQLQGVELFKNFSPEEKPELLKHFYAVPPEYRDILVRRSKDGSFEGIIKEAIDAAGNCRFDDESCVRILLSSTLKDVIEFSLIHEVGHGVQRLAARKLEMSYEDFDRAMHEIMIEGRQHNARNGRDKKLAIRDYSLTDPKEYWSDSFHNYYCSPKSHDFLKIHLPKNYALLQKVLVPPMWLKEPSFLNPDASAYMDAVTSLYNEASKTCDLKVEELSAEDATGLFEVKLSLVANPMETAKLVLNDQVNLATQVSKFRRDLNQHFPACPAE